MQVPESNSKIAVIGSGISGMSAAWFLSQKHEVTLYEKNARLGGHTHTVDIELNQQSCSVDTGFIVFNEPNYPLLTAMLKHLEVDTHPTEMSFAVSIDQGLLEYAGSNLSTLFAQRKNLFSWQHWHMLKEILRFNRLAKNDLELGLNPELTLGSYLQQNNFGEAMQNHYLLPMAAAIWSCPTATMLKFPANSFLQFFYNHGLLNISERPQWRTVAQGARRYLHAIESLNSFNIHYSEVVQVWAAETQNDQVRITSQDGDMRFYDRVVFACHADEAHHLLRNQGFDLLHHFKYQHNEAWLHTDAKLMPKLKKAWSAWNYLSDADPQQQREVAVTYWMNRLQPLPLEQDVFVTLNRQPDPSTVLKRIDYQHPVFDRDAIAAQANLHQIQGRKNCWFAGSYCGYGFHEDGLASAAHLAQLWQIALPWELEQ